MTSLNEIRAESLGESDGQCYETWSVTPVQLFLFAHCEHSRWFHKLHADLSEFFCSNNNPHSFRSSSVTIYLEFKSTELQGLQMVDWCSA